MMAERTALSYAEDEIISDIRNKLAKYDIRSGQYPETPKHFRRAAVLLPITVVNGEIMLLLTQRSRKLRTHPLAVAFPGGIRDDTDDSDIITALRETEEEIGLPPSCVKILAVLNRNVTLPNIAVYPVVGLIPNDFQPEINPQEVETTFYIPLKEFLSSEVKISNFKILGKTFRTFTLKYYSGNDYFVIYGFTANMCVMLARIIFEKDADILIQTIKDYFDHVSQHLISSQSNSKL